MRLCWRSGVGVCLCVSKKQRFIPEPMLDFPKSIIDLWSTNFKKDNIHIDCRTELEKLFKNSRRNFFSNQIFISNQRNRKFRSISDRKCSGNECSFQRPHNCFRTVWVLILLHARQTSDPPLYALESFYEIIWILNRFNVQYKWFFECARWNATTAPEQWVFSLLNRVHVFILFDFLFGRSALTIKPCRTSERNLSISDLPLLLLMSVYLERNVERNREYTRKLTFNEFYLNQT